jgi:2-keto-3-deoxy-L-rhamnonate aldolase RhmA
MFPHPNKLKQKLAAGECIYGIYIQTNSPACIESAASAGYDYVIIDCEHGDIFLSDVIHLIRAAEATDICPIVRVPDNEPTLIRRALEVGAMGIYIPQIETDLQAQAAVDAMKFKTDDNPAFRGACPTIRATKGLGTDWLEFVRWSNENTLAVILIETQAGVRNLDAILRVPGIDTVGLGRFDLAHDLGLYGDRYGETLNSIFDTFVAKAKAAGVPYVARISSTTPEDMHREHEQLVGQGATVFNVGSDRGLMIKAFSDALAPLKACHR